MVNRRSLIKFLFSILLFIFTFNFLRVKKPTSRKVITVNTEDIGKNSVYMIRNLQIAIIYIDNKYKVLSLKCTHLGCTLNIAGDMFRCPCHGSEFKVTGEVIKGPANKNLELLDFDIIDNIIHIYL